MSRFDQDPPARPGTGKKTFDGRVWGTVLFIVLAVWVVFGQTLGQGFVNFDDDKYVYQNAMVQKGVTWAGIKWAFTYGEIGHWHPLTWLSHMLDCQLYGLNAGGHHLTNLLFHTAAAILLFLVLRRMTGALWRSAFVAVVFAIHPLRVESVAWISERKDVLSAFFFMLTLYAYAGYVRRPSSRVRYLSVCLFYALGLLAKDMLVTLPFVLLLLDYWPLGRLDPAALRTWRPLLLEKIPLIALSLASCAVTLLVPEKASSLAQAPPGFRLENVLVSYVTYIRQMFWPTGLAIPYLREPLAPGTVAVAGLLLAGISLAVFLFRKRGYPVVGWLWYLGMLVPVIGFVQVSYYVRADRYTYLPQIGLYLLVTWAVAELGASWRHHRLILGFGAALMVAGLMACARNQVSYWQDSKSLWLHTLAVTRNNYIACDKLGSLYAGEGNINEAMKYYVLSLQIRPDNPEVIYDLANAQAKLGRWDEAIDNYRRALQISPDQPDFLNNLGFALAAKQQYAGAITNFSAALALKPDFADAHNNLASVLFREGDYAGAAEQFRDAIHDAPDDPRFYSNLGDTLVKLNRPGEAAEAYRQALQLAPDDSRLKARLNALGAGAPP